MFELQGDNFLQCTLSSIFYSFVLRFGLPLSNYLRELKGSLTTLLDHHTYGSKRRYMEDYRGLVNKNNKQVHANGIKHTNKPCYTLPHLLKGTAQKTTYFKETFNIDNVLTGSELLLAQPVRKYMFFALTTQKKTCSWLLVNAT